MAKNIPIRRLLSATGLGLLLVELQIKRWQQITLMIRIRIRIRIGEFQYMLVSRESSMKEYKRNGTVFNNRSQRRVTDRKSL